MDSSNASPGLFERLSSLLQREPEDREQLIELLRSAHRRQLLDDDALSITEGALAASGITAREVMVPRSQMEIIDANDSLATVVAHVTRTAHSRFPVIDGNRDNVIGILLAKDLLRVPHDDFYLRDWLRPAMFIPEFKRLDVLLRDFRASRNHLAVVVDEYAGVAGLITIEDVLEQIVGEIEDEHDVDDDQGDDNIQLDHGDLYRVQAQTSVTEFNAAFATRLHDEKSLTIGGLILHHLGWVPQCNEEFAIDGTQFQVLRADSRRIYTLLVSRSTHADPTK